MCISTNVYHRDALLDLAAKYVVPSSQLGSSSSELIIVLAVWVAVGKSGVTGSQGPQNVLQPGGSPKDFWIWTCTLATLSKSSVYLLLYWGGEPPLEKLRQQLLTDQHKALFLRNHIAGG